MRQFAVTAAMVLGLSAQDMARAGTTTGTLAVNIALARNAGLCTSELLSQPSSAIVRIACATGQFVSIVANSSKPFPGGPNAAYQFIFGAGQPLPADVPGTISPAIDAGTVTGMRIFNTSGWLGPIELLVSF